MKVLNIIFISTKKNPEKPSILGLWTKFRDVSPGSVALFSDIRVCYYPEIVLHLGMYVQIFVTDKKINKQNIGKIWVKIHASVFL